MNLQDELFYEDWRDSLRHAVKLMGGLEVVGSELWPGKERKKAGDWLGDCLNPERSAKLDLEEIIFLMRSARAHGYLCAHHQLADETGVTRPEIAPTKTPKQKLAEKMQATAQEFQRLADEMAALDRQDTMTEIRAVNSQG